MRKALFSVLLLFFLAFYSNICFADELVIDITDATEGFTSASDVDAYKIPFVEVSSHTYVSSGGANYFDGIDEEQALDQWIYVIDENKTYWCVSNYWYSVSGRINDYIVYLRPITINMYVDGATSLGDDCYVQFRADAYYCDSKRVSTVNDGFSPFNFSYTWKVPVTANTYTVWLPRDVGYKLSTTQIGFSTDRECYMRSAIFPLMIGSEFCFDYSAYNGVDYIVKGNPSEQDISADLPGLSYYALPLHNPSSSKVTEATTMQAASDETSAAEHPDTSVSRPSVDVSDNDGDLLSEEPAPSQTAYISTDEGGTLADTDTENSISPVRTLLCLGGLILFGMVSFAVFGIGKTREERKRKGERESDVEE